MYNGFLLVFSLMQIFLFAEMTKNECKEFVKKNLIHIPGWCSEKKAEAMMDLVFEIKPDICVELGVFAGASLYPTAVALKHLNHGIVYAIDAWDISEAIRYYPNESLHKNWWSNQNMGLQYKNCIIMLQKNKLDSITVVIKDSFFRAVDKINAIDILHIDSSHTNEGDYIDIIPYIKKVKIGGYIWYDGWNASPDTYDYLKKYCVIKKVINSASCILLQKTNED